MAVNPERARAVALPATLEAQHFDRLAFRTPRKMFAPLNASGRDLNLMFDPDTRDLFCHLAPHAFAPVPGGWGLRGATRCDLDAVEEEMLESALMAAHKMAGPRPGRRQKASQAAISRGNITYPS